MAGLAQKGGAVYSHIRIAERPEDIHAIRIAAGAADLVLGGDIVVAGNKKVLAAVKHGATDDGHQHAPSSSRASSRAMPDFSLPMERLKRAIVADAGRENDAFLDATRAANALSGNPIGANIFSSAMPISSAPLPLSADAIQQAIELNGEAVEMNKAASAGAGARRSIRGLAAPRPASPSKRRAMRASSRNPSKR